MASSSRPVPVPVEVELLDGRASTPPGLSGSKGPAMVAEQTVVVTKAGTGVAALLVVASAVIGLGVWQLIDGPATMGLETDRRLTDVLARQSPSPTIRWETPPKFGGRGGDYSQVGSSAPSERRPGPYR